MSKIVWIDMEMTGLNVRKDRIMEIACLISDNRLNVLAEHPSIIINQPDALLESMDEWCTTTHTNVINILIIQSITIFCARNIFIKSFKTIETIQIYL